METVKQLRKKIKEQDEIITELSLAYMKLKTDRGERRERRAKRQFDKVFGHFSW